MSCTTPAQRCRGVHSQLRERAPCHHIVQRNPNAIPTLANEGRCGSAPNAVDGGYGQFESTMTSDELLSYA